MISADRPHRRRNPLTGRHVLVSPQRMLRPWQGGAEPAPASRASTHDAGCYLCPGNTRASGDVNPDYRGVFVFDNDFPALLPAEPGGADDPLFGTQAVGGATRVICFSPDHGATLADLDDAALRRVVDAWCDETARLGKTHAYVTAFENKGAMMGCSNPHPHGQVWATDYLPDEIVDEDRHQRDWQAEHGTSLLLDVAAREAAAGTRVIEANDDWLAIVPHWATWPFETLLLPRFAVARMAALGAAQRSTLAAVIGRLTRRYDALFGISFPYSMGWHGAPCDGSDATHWQLHAHFYPPLLRSAGVRKFMVGFELLAEAQRDLTPEAAAEILRAVTP